jgi:hypothetical protein
LLPFLRDVVYFVSLRHVDPPYFEQHDYTGISEFFWQVLRAALDPVLDVLFPPERVKIPWSPRSASLPKAREIRGEPGSGFGDRIEQFFSAATPQSSNHTDHRRADGEGL